MFRRQSVQQVSACAGHRAGSDLPSSGLGVPSIGAPRGAAAADSSVGAVGAPQLTAASYHRSGRA